MKLVTGATPLVALEAVALDTETTGLDTVRDRVVQIGAVRLARGRVTGQTFETLVDPGIPIPEGGRGIHGIDDTMVRSAPAFAEAWARFGEFSGERVLIGYSIGFDLAVLEHEARRAGLAWTRPRTLCVRLLTQLLRPNLPDQSLDMIASWLGVTIAGRHSAPGDARAAADIFLALLPRLAERGLRTLGEAERACLDLSGEREAAARAGWADPATRPEAPPRAFRAVDPYAYRHRVRDLMSSPPVVVPETMEVRAALAKMAEGRISSLFVSASGETGRPVGDYAIVTERDMMRLVAAEAENAFAVPVGRIASRPLASIRAEAFVYRAVARMDRLRIRHLAVRSEAGHLEGIVSARDLLRLRAGSAIALDDAIEAAASGPEMAELWSTLPAIAASLLEEEVAARTVAEIVSEELRAMTRRAAVLGENAMVAEGLGPAPCDYAVLVLGSGGRGESLLAADQDNAIVFAEGEPGGEADRWFAELGARMAATLDTAGVPFCKGGVMARNAEWRGSLATWRARAADWVRRSRPADLLNVDIFYDLAPVHGRLELGHAVFEDAWEAARDAPVFAKLLGARLEDLASPFSFFGRLQGDNGRLDLKKHGLFPIVAFARALAVAHQVRARSTRRRLEGLLALEIGGEGDLRAVLDAHETVLAAVLAQQSRDLEEGIPVSNKVELSRLSARDHRRLSAALRALANLPQLTRDLMFAKG